MNQFIVLTIGHDSLVIPSKPSVAGKLIELLAEAVPARKDYGHYTGLDKYRIEAKRANISVQVVGVDQILAPKPEDRESDDVVELKALPAGLRLLKS